MYRMGSLGRIGHRERDSAHGRRSLGHYLNGRTSPGTRSPRSRRYGAAMAVETTRQKSSDERAATRTVQTPEGRTVAYATFGSASGAPLLAFHGTPGSRLFGRLLDTQAREQDVRVVAIDRPGFGRTESVPGFGPADVPDLVDPVLDSLGCSRVGVLGFSGGAPYALALAAARPDTVRSVDVVSGAVAPSLVEEPPRQMRLLSGMARRTPRVLGWLLRGQSWLARRRPAIIASQYTDPESAPESAVETVAAEFREAMAETRAGTIRELQAVGTTWPVDLETVEPSVRLWHGDRDENVPIEGARRLETRLPNATLLTVEGADHLQTLLECREEVLEGDGDQRESSESTSYASSSTSTVSSS